MECRSPPSAEQPAVDPSTEQDMNSVDIEVSPAKLGNVGWREAAAQLWASDYSELFELEYCQNRRFFGGSFVSQLPPSTYRQRLNGEALEKYALRERRRERDLMAAAIHSSNMRVWPLSLIARSIAYFNQSSQIIQRTETQQRRLASRPIVFQILRHLVKVHLPSSLGTLSASDLSKIAGNHGSPYTEDYNLVLIPLQPDTVKVYLREFALDALVSVSIAASSAGCTPQNLTLRNIAHALCGRPNTDPGGPSEFTILEPLMSTDTKSYDDFIKITQHLSRHSGPSCVVEIFAGDGQSVIRFKDLKKKWPHLYSRWLIAVGGFHEHAHTMFAFVEMFWKPLVCSCMHVLQIERVQEITQNLEHNNYAHVQNALHAMTVGIVSFLVQDVRNPPPGLLLQDLDAYEALIDHAGGHVLLAFLRYAGFPTLQWQRASRMGDGARLKKLFAYSYHVYRSVCHKPTAAQIALIALLGFCCALPALQVILLTTVSISLLGRRGSNMYLDRLVECINKLQQGSKRSNNAASFARAMDMTQLLRAILHVRHAFQSSEHGATESDDPVTTSMCIQARLLQDYFLRECGRDLTASFTTNPFWYTGNPVSLHTGDYRTRRPWEFVWSTAAGRTAGKGRARSESWSAYAIRMLFEHFFPY